MTEIVKKPDYFVISEISKEWSLDEREEVVSFRIPHNLKTHYFVQKGINPSMTMLEFADFIDCLPVYAKPATYCDCSCLERIIIIARMRGWGFAPIPTFDQFVSYN